MEQQTGDSGGENATLNRVLDFFKELRRNSEWAHLHLETTVTGDLAVNLSVRCSAAVSSSGAGMPRTGGERVSSRTTRISPSRARRNYRRRLEFLDRKNSAEKPEERNVTVTDEALPETTETGSRDIMDLDMVENLQETDGDSPAEEECVWRQNEPTNGDTSSGEETLLDNEDIVMAKIHGVFLVNDVPVDPKTVFELKECFDEMRNDFLDYYKVQIEAMEFLSSESCNNSCPTGLGESCSTVTSVKMKMKRGVNHFPDNEFTFGEMKTFRVVFPSLGIIS